MATSEKTLTGERGEILEILAEQRDTLRITVRNLGDEDAAKRTTASELCLGGVIKHVLNVERGWINIMAGRPETGHKTQEEWANEFKMPEGRTLADLLDEYEAVARETEKTVAALPDLDQRSPLPEAPWFPAGASWSARRILLHLIRETAQHAGHADIIRESLDGGNTTMSMAADMGLEF